MTGTTQLPVVSSKPTASTTTTSNARALADFERSILTHLRDATKPWFAIAQVFLEASEQLKPNTFKQLCANVRLSYSTARKLIKVAKSPRLRNYEDRLACIDSWSTLHEIAKLDAASFDKFAAEYLANTNDVRVFMRSDVEKFNSKSAKTASTFASYFTVQVSSAAALSTRDEQILASVAKFIEEQLAGKAKVKWEIEKPTAVATLAIALVQ